MPRKTRLYDYLWPNQQESCYDVFDSFLWKGYLILEESSAESVIRDVLIPRFFPPTYATQLRTIAASGVNDVERRLIDFLSLFVFIHTAPLYKERAWVAIDGGPVGKKVIEGLKTKFSKDWPEDHFRCFASENFESYYPERFKQEAAKVLAMPRGPERHKAKGELAKTVVNWALANPKEAKTEFETSAKEVLGFLREIQKKLS